MSTDQNRIYCLENQVYCLRETVLELADLIRNLRKHNTQEDANASR